MVGGTGWDDVPGSFSGVEALAAAGGSGGLTGSFTDTNVDIGYTKNTTAAQNIVNAAHTSVPVNTFFISNGVEMSRGSTGIGHYRGSTSTTYNTDKTYTGEYVQVDMMHVYKLLVSFLREQHLWDTACSQST